jgi:hypothetical protein
MWTIPWVNLLTYVAFWCGVLLLETWVIIVSSIAGQLDSLVMQKHALESWILSVLHWGCIWCRTPITALTVQQNVARPAKSVALYVNAQIGRSFYLYCLPIRGSIRSKNTSSYLSVNREDNEPIFHLRSWKLITSTWTSTIQHIYGCN